MIIPGLFSTGKFGIIPDPPEYDQLEFEGCPYDYEEIDAGDECLCCAWYETCKACFIEGGMK